MLSAGSLPGLRSGIMVDDFQIAGITLYLTERLKISVRNLIPWEPRCFRWRFEMLSGPLALEDLHFFIASAVSAGLNCGASFSSFFLIS